MIKHLLCFLPAKNNKIKILPTDNWLYIIIKVNSIRSRLKCNFFLLFIFHMKQGHITAYSYFSLSLSSSDMVEPLTDAFTTSHDVPRVNQKHM